MQWGGQNIWAWSAGHRVGMAMHRWGGILMNAARSVCTASGVCYSHSSSSSSLHAQRWSMWLWRWCPPSPWQCFMKVSQFHETALPQSFRASQVRIDTECARWGIVTTALQECKTNHLDVCVWSDMSLGGAGWWRCWLRRLVLGLHYWQPGFESLPNLIAQ